MIDKNQTIDKDWYRLKIDKIFALLNTSDKGLKAEDIKERIKQYGYNELIKEKKLGAFGLLLRQFKNPLVLILFVAMTVSFSIGASGDGFIILVIILITNTVGFIQEFKAGKALDSLSKMIVYKVRVLRNGKKEIIEAKNIVIGDIFLLETGDMIHADARLIESFDVCVSEAILTGEAEPSTKTTDIFSVNLPLADRKNMLYKGTTVSQGSGKAVVVAIGMQTELGKIASMIGETKEDLTPLQEQVNKFGWELSIFLVFVNVLIMLFGVYSGKPIFDMFLIAVAVVVSAVPEGLLPIMFTLLAIGMQRLAKRKGLVRKLIAAETLGSVSVICTDKTGTLTTGQMELNKIITDAGETVSDNYKKEDRESDKINLVNLAFKIMALANNTFAEKKDGKTVLFGNFTDKALFVAADKAGFNRDELEKDEIRLHEIPFNSKDKLMATIHSCDEGNSSCIAYIKGAPEEVISRVKYLATKDGKKTIFTDEHNKFYNDKISFFAEQGSRIVALATKDVVDKDISFNDLSDLTFVGLAILKDKVRNDVKASLEECKQAGIKVKVITGDHLQTAIAVAKEVGLLFNDDEVITGEELDKIKDEDFGEVVRKTVIFSRVAPFHKLKIVEALQKDNEVIAMTGDGVNDAPALKKSDIGVVVGDSTDTAKNVADLVLMDNSFKTIVEAVRGGRIIFGNIQKAILYLFTDAFQELMVIGFAVLAGWPLPLLPIQIFWIKLIEEPLPVTSLAFEKPQKGIMNQKPRYKNEPFLNKSLKFMIAFYAIIMNSILLGIFYFFWKNFGEEYARSVIFLTMGVSTLFYIYAVRTYKSDFNKENFFSNKFLFFATGAGFFLFYLSFNVPFLMDLLKIVSIGWQEWLMACLYGFFGIFTFIIGKKIANKLFENNPNDF